MSSSQVDLDPQTKDGFGLYVPRVTKKQHPNDVLMHRYFQQKLTELAQAAGAEKTLVLDVPGATIGDDMHQKGSTHNHGTCRMGNDPKSSVVNKWCQSHEVPNLWITDASVFPTSGGYNPTLTILANAYRVADHFLAQARRQSL